MKILITGISGFVARHFVELLSSTGDSCEIMGLYNNRMPDFSKNNFANCDISLHQVDLVEGGQLAELLQSFRPEYVLHLASQSSVAYSWKHPAECIRDNVAMFLNLVDQIRLSGIKCRILSVGSAEEYGNVDKAELPLKESYCLDPVSPYGVSRLLQEKIVQIYSKSYQQEIIHTRSFNHIGPYQEDKFVIASFARQIAEQLLEENDSISIATGDISIIRDFTDVRDVVNAYLILLKEGQKGSIYNVCSGVGYTLKEVLEKFEVLVKKPIRHYVDEQNLRPSENPVVIGDNSKIKRDTGWQPVIPIEKSLSDLVIYWKSKLAVARPS